jgi:DNA-binding transcriptional MerR regulator
MNIKKVSEITGLSVHTLRYYEKIGLLIDVNRNSSGHRFYTNNDLKWIEFLKRLKETGMPLPEMKKFAVLRYKGDSTILERRMLLETHNQRIRDKIKSLQKNQQSLNLKIDYYKRTESDYKTS